MILPFKLALATRSLATAFRQAVAQASQAGVQGIQIDARDELPPGSLSDTGRREFLHRLEEAGLKVASLTFPTRRTFYDLDQLDARVAAVRSAMEFAWQLGARVLTARVGRIPPDAESSEHQLLREVLNDLARHGNHVGVTLALTSSGETAEALSNLLASIQGGPLGLDFDPVGFVLARQPPHVAYRAVHQHVVHFLARDGIREREGGGAETPLGRGEVDWLELLPLLDEARYQGWVTVLRTSGDDRAGDAVRGVTFLQNVLQG